MKQFFAEKNRKIFVKVSDTVLHDKTFNTAKTPKFDGYQRGLASVIHKIFKKKSVMHVDQPSSYAIPTRTGIASDDQQLTKELHKQIIRKYRSVSYACTLRITFGQQTWLICS